MINYLDSNGFSSLVGYLPNLYRPIDIINYTFVIWAQDFSFDPPTGALLVESLDDFSEIMRNRARVDHQVLLRKKSSTPDNPSIEDDFDCVFLQGNPSDGDSAACIKEKGGYSDYKYWQKCLFTAAQRENCSIVVINVAALTVCLVILLLIIVILSIYWFKKKSNRSKIEEDRKVTPSNGNTEFNEYNQYNEYNEYSEYIDEQSRRYDQFPW